MSAESVSDCEKSESYDETGWSGEQQRQDTSVVRAHQKKSGVRTGAQVIEDKLSYGIVVRRTFVALLILGGVSSSVLAQSSAFSVDFCSAKTLKTGGTLCDDTGDGKYCGIGLFLKVSQGNDSSNNPTWEGVRGPPNGRNCATGGVCQECYPRYRLNSTNSIVCEAGHIKNCRTGDKQVEHCSDCLLGYFLDYEGEADFRAAQNMVGSSYESKNPTKNMELNKDTPPKEFVPFVKKGYPVMASLVKWSSIVFTLFILLVLILVVVLLIFILYFGRKRELRFQIAEVNNIIGNDSNSFKQRSDLYSGDLDNWQQSNILGEDAHLSGPKQLLKSKYNAKGEKAKNKEVNIHPDSENMFKKKARFNKFGEATSEAVKLNNRIKYAEDDQFDDAKRDEKLKYEDDHENGHEHKHTANKNYYDEEEL